MRIRSDILMRYGKAGAVPSLSDDAVPYGGVIGLTVKPYGAVSKLDAVRSAT